MSEISRKTPKILVTNDDGIESILLREMVARLASKFNLVVAAPAEERSFCGRSFSFRGDVGVEAVSGLECPAFAIDGTPSDCVNIGLGHLCGDSLPDLVVSGPNIGRNTSLGFIHGSGTVAGAMEGAFWNLPALAVSQGFESNTLAREFHSMDQLPDSFRPIFDRGLDFVEKAIERVLAQPVERLRVDSINLPHTYAEDAAEFREVPPIDYAYGSFFKKTESGAFTSGMGERKRVTPEETFTDLDCLKAGYPSWTVLNYGKISGGTVSSRST